jgi:hypothetical protein
MIIQRTLKTEIKIFTREISGVGFDVGIGVVVDEIMLSR